MERDQGKGARRAMVTTATRQRDLERVRIILFESDRRAGRSMSRYMAQSGCRVLAVQDALEGVERILEFAPQVVVLSLDMPDLVGDRLVRLIRAVTKAPVLVMGGGPPDGLLTRALNAGADAYVPDPITRSLLEAAVRACVRRVDGAPEAATPQNGKAHPERNGPAHPE